MKAMTPFQEALLAAAESQFADVPEEEQIEIHPSQEFYDNIPGKRRLRKTLPKAFLIAAALALVVGVTAVYRHLMPGEPEIFKFSYREIDHSPRFLEIQISEEIAKAGASNYIETYYLPTLDLSPENADYMEVKKDVLIFRLPVGKGSLSIPQGFSCYSGIYTDRIPSRPNSFYGSWQIHGKTIHFSQSLAKDVSINTPFLYLYYDDISLLDYELEPKIKTETLQIGNHEVLSVLEEYSSPMQIYHWYWTDGDYIFSLMGEDVEKSYMQQLMESVRPLEDSSTYFGKE